MKLLSTLFVALTLFVGTVSAQTLTEGYLKMEVADVKADDEQMQSMIKQMMQGSVYEFWFNESHGKAQINMMGGMMDMVTLINNETKDVEMLMNAMGQKSYVVSNQSDAATKDVQKMDVKIDESDTKEILGYTCKKATISMGEQMAFSAYITEDISLSNSLLQGMENVNLPGFPLEYNVNAPGMMLTIKAVEIKKEVDKSIFKINPEGYTKMTQEEFAKSLGKMAGGMGF